MKYKFSTILMSACLLAGSWCMTSCNDDDLADMRTYVNGVSLEAFGPCPLTRGSSMEVIGVNLGKVDKVLFPKGNQRLYDTKTYEEASFTLNNEGKLIVTVPNEVVPGKLRLVVGNDTIVSSADITYDEEVEVSDVSLPSSDMRAGDVITISGEYVWGIVSLTFPNNVEVFAEDFLVNTRSEVQVAVPLAAVSGEVTYYDGNANEIQETLIENLTLRQPTVTSISNESPELGSAITIYGTDLDLVGCANFPYVDSVAVTINETGTELYCTVPAKTAPGDINLAQYSTLNVAVPFSPLMLEVTDITPKEELNAGDQVTITGNRLEKTQYIVLPGGVALAADEFTGSSTQITFTVPEGMGDGAVQVVQHENYLVETDKIAMRHEGAINVIWSGSFSVGDWGGNQDLAWGKYDWSTVEAGTQMVINYELDSSATYWQLRVGMGDGWGPLTGTDDVIHLEAGSDTYIVTLTEEMLAELRGKGGLILSGCNYTLKQVGFLIPEQVIWSGTFNGNAWNGFEELDWGKYDWSTFQSGQTIVVTFASTTVDLEWGCIIFKTAGDGWPELSIGQVNFEGSADDQTIEFTPTDEDIARINSENGLVLQGDGVIYKSVAIR